MDVIFVDCLVPLFDLLLHSMVGKRILLNAGVTLEFNPSL